MRDWKRESSNESFTCLSLLWDPYFQVFENGIRNLHIDSPLCTACRTQVEFDATTSHGICINPDCGKEFDLPMGLERARQIVHYKYEAYLRSGKKVIALDLPPGFVEAKSEDENYWIYARIGQKGGKKMGVIWMGEKLHNQELMDKVQFFVDFDDEQVRFDKGNMPPMKLLADVKVEFENSITNLKKK